MRGPTLSANEPVLTFYFLGTGGHRERLPNVITQFAKYSASGSVAHPKAADTHFVHLFDGPGGKSSFGQTGHPMPGQYVYNPEDGTKKPRHTVGMSKKIHRAMQGLSGRLVGDGVEDNILEAVMVIKRLHEKGNLPKTINMIGHSRGGDTALRLANVLNVMYPDIQVNILAIDPVAGPARRGHRKAKVVPENVKNYKAILMEDENRKGFEPQDKSRTIIAAPEKTRVTYQIYPGSHGDTLKYKGHEHVNPLVEIAWDDVFKFCNDSGTRLVSNLNGRPPPYVQNTSKNPKLERRTDIEAKAPFDLQQRLKVYFQMKEHRLSYYRRRPAGARNRDFMKRKNDYVNDSDYFVNKEHREIFKRVYPNLFDYLFQGGIEGMTKADALKEANMFRKNHPYGFKILRSRGVKVNDENEIVLHEEARGNYHRETFEVLDKLPVAHSYFAYLEYAAKNAVDQFMRSGSGPGFVIAEALRDRVDEIKASKNTLEDKIILLKATIESAARVSKNFSGTKELVYQLQAVSNDPITYAASIVRMLNNNINKTSLNKGEPARIAVELKSQVVKIARSDSMDAHKKNEALTQLLESIVMPKDLDKKAVQQFKVFQKEVGALLKYRKSSYDYADKAIKRVKSYLFSNKINRLIAKVTGNLMVNKAVVTIKREVAKKALSELKNLKTERKGFNKDEVNGVIRKALNDPDVQAARADANLSEGSFERTMRDVLLRDAPSLSSSMFMQKQHEQQAQQEQQDEASPDITAPHM